jgi:hypothetical protein
MINHLWNLKIQILPVVISLIICELPGITRWLKKLPYIPIYFSVFPFNILNRDLSIYLGEDYFYGDGRNLRGEDIERLRKHIINVSMVSAALSVIITPLLGGFFSAFFLPRDSFLGFCIIFIAYKLIGMTEAALDFGKHAVANKKTMTWFLLVYLIYFGLFLYVFGTTYDWTEPFVSQGDWIGLFKNIHSVLFGKYIFSVLIIAFLARFAYSAITDRELRDQLNPEPKSPRKAKKRAAIPDEKPLDQKD